MKVIRDDAWRAFARAADGQDWGGQRIKRLRSTTLRPGGRATLTLFELVDDAGRPHPRLRVAMPLPDDPAPPASLFAPPPQAPTTVSALESLVEAALSRHADLLTAEDLRDGAPAQSPAFLRNAVRGQRRSELFAQARRYAEELISAGALPIDEAGPARRMLAAREDLAHAGLTAFDDDDTGTYHSFGHDAPFVHYLEQMIASLPVEGREAFASLATEQQEAVRRQRGQATRWLDHLMRHKYAHDGVVETDIERSLGGFLIDRETRQIVSEEEASRSSLVPTYALLRIEPTAEHEHAGAWVYRDAAGALRLQDHTAVEGAPPVRSVARAADELTFRRAPGDPHLREGVRFDWNGDGYVQQGPIDWISWAGHCDIKAVVEQLGITLTGEPRPTLSEFRSDRGETTSYDRKLLLEMLCSTLELGSLYRTLDGSRQLQRGVHRFGGARNDSRPDRLQFQGPEAGAGFRWPLGGRAEAFAVGTLADSDGLVDLSTVFLRHLPSLETLSFSGNPRFLKTIEGDYSLIDVTGMHIGASIQVDTVDPTSGYLSRTRKTTRVQLQPDAEPGRDFLGTHLHSPEDRSLYRVYLDRGDAPRIVAELERWEQDGDAWVPVPQPGKTVVLPLAAPLAVTLSREMKRDDPEVFTELLHIATRQGRNINADTDMAAQVWNGTVTKIHSERLAEDREGRTEHWRVGIDARFGRATLEYLLRRDDHGAVEASCPLPPGDDVPRNRRQAPDFLWQDFPDVGSKGVEGGEWIVNQTMVKRGIAEVHWEPSAPGGFYVYDDQVKNVYEMLFCALGGYPFTVVHDNKRYGFADEAAWRSAIEDLQAKRSALSFEE